MKKLSIILTILLSLIDIKSYSIKLDPQDIYKQISAWNILEILQDANKIHTLGSRNSNQISLAAYLDIIRSFGHLIFNQSKIELPITDINYTTTYNDITNNHTHNLSLNLMPIAILKFIINNVQINANAKKIAIYNKESQRDLSESKRIQYIWLAINKLAPYMGIALVKKPNQNLGIDYKQYITDTFNQLQTISNISEVIRKHKLHNLEKGDYKNFKLELDSNNKKDIKN
ncbi:MAG: hypothetical protein M0R03_16655 [Novosphingobium sp.]|nr:hypothetical protein [Novosphingobium sp.]